MINRKKNRKKYREKRKSIYNLKDSISNSYFLLKQNLPSLIKFSVLSKQPILNAIGDIRHFRHSDWGLLLTASFLGIVVGFFITLFHWSMEWAEVFFGSVQMKAGEVIPWKILLVPLIPAFGGLLIGILRKTLFKGATIEGLDSLIQAIVYREGRMDWRNSFKSITFAAFSIGSGGGAGREGPTIVLGASLGSSLAQLLRLKPQQIKVLCGAGAAAAISGIFNAPLGGIVFALEAIIGGISIRAFTPLVISSVLATATTRILVGNKPLLITPMIMDVQLLDYFFLAIAGVLSGFIAIYYLKVYNQTTKMVTKAINPFPEMIKPAIGGFAVGLILLALPTMLEITYNPINNVIAGKGMPLIGNSIFLNFTKYFDKDSIFILFIIVATATFLIKPISNSISLASRGAGGTFAPVLKAGAMFGFVFGSILAFVNPGSSIGLYAIVCAAAVLSGTFQLPLAGGIILFEISHNYDLILPLVFASVISSFIVQKSGIRTFNPLQKEFVDDEEQIHPTLKSKI